MSQPATWSTQATPLVRVAAAVVLTLGTLSLVIAALLLALDGDLRHPVAISCLALAVLFIAARLRRESRLTPSSLCWCPHAAAFHLAGEAGKLDLVRVWQGPGWVTLGLRHQATPRRLVHLVVWKSALPAPLWNQLALRLATTGNSDQNKENP